MTEPVFRSDLYGGTAGAYDQFRPPYPAELIAGLAGRTGSDGTGRLLDLACGTGQVTFALSGAFAEVWAVDQEAGMIELASRKAAEAGLAARFRFLTCAAEDLVAPRGHFDLVTVGNAFHRLPRTLLAGAMFGWLRPGGHAALLWGGSPWFGDEPWQRTLTGTMRRWQKLLGADRIPAGYQETRDARPDAQVLTEAGFEFAGRYDFPVRLTWTADELAGYLASTSVLSAAALGGRRAEFDAELRREVTAARADGQFIQPTVFSYDLARRPLRPQAGRAALAGPP